MKRFCSLLCALLLTVCLLPGTAESGDAPQAPQEAIKQIEDEEAEAPEEPEAEAFFLAPGQEPVLTETSYTSENVAITITARRVEIPVNAKVTQKSDAYIADIRIKNIRSYQRAFPGKKWSSLTRRITTLSQENGAILSMSGDSANNLNAGWVIINGQVVRDGSKKRNRRRDLCILYKTGEMVTLSAQDVNNEAIQQAVENGQIWQLFLFGPRLLDDEGHAMEKFNSDVGPVNPRSVIGYYAPGHYCFVQIDGRQTQSQLEKGKKNKGLTLKNLSKLMEELGCRAAYNLDGGRTSQMYFGGKIISSPQNGGRTLGDIVLIREP